MDNIKRIKSEWKAILSEGNGIHAVLDKIEKCLPEGSAKYQRYLLLKSFATELFENNNYSAADAQQLFQLISQLHEFIDEVEIADLATTEEGNARQDGPALNKPAAITKKKGDVKALIANIAAITVLTGIILALLYNLFMKVNCETQWEKANATNTCQAYEYFLEHCSSCPQLLEAQSKAKALCAN